MTSKNKAALFRGCAIFGMAVSAVSVQPALAQSAGTANQKQPAGVPQPSASDDIVVTARFRTEAAQSIAAPITAISSATLVRQGITDFSDIARSVPGLASTDRGPNANEVFLRGVSNQTGEALADSGNAGALVTQYVDDVPVATANASQKDFNLFDFARIEVLRGPQPTLYGEGAMGGVIRYVSADPSLSGGAVSGIIVRSQVSGTDGGGVNVSENAAATLGIVPDVLAVRGVFNFRHDSGFINDPVRNVNEINPYRSIGGRFVALFKPNSSFSARLSGNFSRDRTADGAYIDVGSNPADLTYSAPIGANSSDKTDLLSFKMDYNTGPITLTSVSGYYKRDRVIAGYDAGNSGGFSVVLGAPVNLANQYATSDTTFTQELRVASHLSGPFNFIGGFYFKDKKSNVVVSITSPDGSIDRFLANPTGDLLDNSQTYRTRQYSGFLEGTLSLTDHLRLVGGARYLYEKITSTVDSYISLAGLTPPIPTLDFANFLGLYGLPRTFAFTLNRVLPKASIEVDVAKDVLAYALVSEGVRNGNTTGIVTAFQVAGGGTPNFNPALFAKSITFDSDKIWNYEAGIKTRSLDGRLTANLTAYYSRYYHPQILEVTPFALTTNGPDAEIKGVEFESTFHATKVISLYGNVAYTHARFIGSALTIPALAPAISADVMKGNHLTNVPDWTYNIGLNFDQPIVNSDTKLIGNINFNYIGSRFANPQNFVSSELPAIGIANVRLGVEHKIWTLEIFANNLFNRIKPQSIGALTSFAHATASGQLDAPNITEAINRPRVIGADLTVRF